MAYYTKVLLPDEKVLYLGTIHWLIYLKPWFFLLLDLIALVAVLGLHVPGQPFIPLGGQSLPPVSYVATGIFLILLATWILQFLSAWTRRTTTEIVVTDKRVIFKEGLIRRRTMEMNMNKVESVDVQQSVWGRILNFGTVLIRGTGSTYEPLRLVDRPLALRTAILAQ